MDEIVEQVCECAIYDFKDTIGECSTIPIVKENFEWTGSCGRDV